MNTVLLVDDESAILQMLGDYLKPSYNIKRAINGKTAIKFIKEQTPDIVVLDWMLPDIQGTEVAAWIRGHESFKTIPIIMLTAKSQEQDKLKGFDVGADDYLTKPFSLVELGARIKALLKRANLDNNDLIQYHELSVNTNEKQVYVNNQPVRLTSKEFKFLKILVKNPRRIYSRDQIIDLIWEGNNTISDRAVDVFISRIRKALNNQSCSLLQTVRGLGYRLAID